MCGMSCWLCAGCVQDYIRKKNKWLVKIHEWVQANGGDPIIPFSGAFENEVRPAAVARHGWVGSSSDCPLLWMGLLFGLHGLHAAITVTHP